MKRPDLVMGSKLEQPRGRPLKLGNYLDEKVKEFIRSLRKAGGVVNSLIVIAAAKGVINHEDPTLLRENGGSLEIGKKWAQSVLSRMGYARKKATKAARKLPADFEMVRDEFIHRVKDAVVESKIPPEFIINFDQTGVKIIPSGEWTMDRIGEKQVLYSALFTDCIVVTLCHYSTTLVMYTRVNVTELVLCILQVSVIGVDDKREITALLSISMDGKMLPCQIIYAGKTKRCIPEINFPPQWHVTYSDNHWSTAQTMLDYADNILIPYVRKLRYQHAMPNQVQILHF